MRTGRRWILTRPAPVLQKWASADLNNKFKLPVKNEFIPTNFEIYPLEKDAPPVPTLIKVTSLFISRDR